MTASMEMIITRAFVAFFGNYIKKYERVLYDQLLTNLASCEILALGRFCWDLAVLGPSRPLTNTPQYRPQARLVRG